MAYCSSIIVPLVIFPRPASVVLAQLNTASSRDSLGLLKELYFRYMQDTNYTGVRNVLATQNTVPARRAMVELDLATNNPSGAWATLSLLPNVTPNDITFKNYYTMQYHHVLANRPCHTIDSTQENLVRTWRNQKTNIMGTLMASLHKNCGDSVWVDCEMLGLCGSTSGSRYASSQTKMLETEKELLGNPYPNPAQEIIYIPYHADIASQITIQDIYGKTVQSYTVQGAGVMQVSVKDLPKGIYMCTMTTNKQSVHKKFVVQ
jgi:hypothetical protein